MKNLLTGILVIVGFIIGSSDILADEAVLIIPEQEWSDGEYKPMFIRYFRSHDWEVQPAHVKCSSYARWLHTSRISAPNYSSCMHPSTMAFIYPMRYL